MNKEESDLNRPFNNSVDEDTPTHRDYIFKLHTGEEKIAKGFLAVAAGFVAVGTGSGDLSLVVPMDNLVFAEELPTIQGSA